MLGSPVASSAAVAGRERALPTPSPVLRHTAFVRVTHWITVLSFLALLISGVEIVFSHPRFYWGEVGNVNTTPLFSFPVPSSRATVPTGYGYVLPDQNGWSRALHFQAGWVVVLTGLAYAVWGIVASHFRESLVPARADLTWGAVRGVIAGHLRRTPPDGAEARSYNVLQRIAYLCVIFVLFPLAIWTGLAMSPAFVSAVPAAVTALGGTQSARTIHLFVTVALVLFLATHVAMVWLSGFRDRMGAMIGGRAGGTRELHAPAHRWIRRLAAHGRWSGGAADVALAGRAQGSPCAQPDHAARL